MNRWLCFFYDTEANSACIIEFANMGATPISHEDEIIEAIEAAGLSEHALFNGFVDVSDIQDPTIMIDGCVFVPKTVRVK